MAETDTVVARLEDLAGSVSKWGFRTPAILDAIQLLRANADLIARLQAENEALRRERDEARFSPLGDNHHNALKCPYCNPGWVEQVAAREAAEAKAARLKEALTKMIAHYVNLASSGDCGLWDFCAKEDVATLRALVGEAK